MLQFGQFVVTRFFLAIVTLLTVSFIVFTLMEMVPANCAERYLSYKSFQGGQISEEDIAAVTESQSRAKGRSFATSGSFSYGGGGGG